MFNPDALRDRILKQFPTLAPDSKIGVWSSLCKDQTVVDQPNGVIVKMIATTNDIDLDREVVVPEGARTDYFFNNNSIFVDHYYDADHCIGKRRNAKLMHNLRGEATGWEVDFHIFNLKNPLAADMIVFAKDGSLASSIGFQALDYGKPEPSEMVRYKQGDVTPRSIVREWDWLELSVTMFPCNVMAAQVGLSASDEKEYKRELVTKRAEYVAGLYRKNLISSASAKLYIPDKPAPRRLSVDLSTPRRMAASI